MNASKVHAHTCTQCFFFSKNVICVAQGELQLPRLTQGLSCENVSIKRIERSSRGGPQHPFARTHMVMHHTYSPVTVDTNTLFDGVQTTSDCPKNQSFYTLPLKKRLGLFLPNKPLPQMKLPFLSGSIADSMCRGMGCTFMRGGVFAGGSKQ